MRNGVKPGTKRQPKPIEADPTVCLDGKFLTGTKIDDEPDPILRIERLLRSIADVVTAPDLRPVDLVTIRVPASNPVKAKRTYVTSSGDVAPGNLGSTSDEVAAEILKILGARGWQVIDSWRYQQTANYAEFEEGYFSEFTLSRQSPTEQEIEAERFFYTKKEIAAMLGVTVPRVERWMANKNNPLTYEVVPHPDPRYAERVNIVVFPKKALEEWVMTQLPVIDEGMNWRMRAFNAFRKWQLNNGGSFASDSPDAKEFSALLGEKFDSDESDPEPDDSEE